VSVEVIQGLDALPAAARECVLTVGNFDGVHVGHQRILRAARALADEARSRVCVVTFDPPPASVRRPGQPSELILPVDLKHSYLRERGADLIVVIEPTGDFLAGNAEDFVRDVIVERFGARHVVEGPGFRFGRGRAGSVETLRQMAGEAGFEVTEVSPVTVELPGRGEVRVSSSAIRGMIRGGDLDGAARCLTRPFTLYGRVVGGERRGRALEFPTANVDPGRLIVPGDGVYAAWAEIGGGRHPAAVSIGTKPTFGPAPRAIEVNLIDAGGDFYDQPIAVTFVARLRDQQKFPGADSLRAQIAKDIERVRELCR